MWSQKLVFEFGMFSGVSCFLSEVCGCVPGLLRTGRPVVPQWFFLKRLSHFGYKTGLRKLVLKMNPRMSK
jgi:hypothetical protein